MRSRVRPPGHPGYPTEAGLSQVRRHTLVPSDGKHVLLRASPQTARALGLHAFPGDLGHTGTPQGEGAPRLLQAPRAFTTHGRRAWQGTRVPSEQCRDFSRATGWRGVPAAETASRLLTPRSASAWPGEGLPLLQRRHEGDRRPRELSLSPGCVAGLLLACAPPPAPRCGRVGPHRPARPGTVSAAGRGRVDGSSVGPRGQAACTHPYTRHTEGASRSRACPTLGLPFSANKRATAFTHRRKRAGGKPEQFQTSLGFAKCERSVHRRSSKQNFQSGLSPWSRWSNRGGILPPAENKTSNNTWDSFQDPRHQTAKHSEPGAGAQRSVCTTGRSAAGP